MTPKQVIVIRSDLKLRRGKEIAQGAHASAQWLREKVLSGKELQLSDEQLQWLSGNYRKVVLRVMSEKALRDLHYEAQNRGLTAHLVIDDGLTEVPPGTATALAIGPHAEDVFVGLTDHLPLY
jgi:peptidyl-tRNA hydrolase, PTH2 family